MLKWVKMSLFHIFQKKHKPKVNAAYQIDHLKQLGFNASVVPNTKKNTIVTLTKKDVKVFLTLYMMNKKFCSKIQG